MQTYTKNDLEDFADLSGMSQFDFSKRWTSVNRSDALAAVLDISKDDITVVNHGSYQGTMLFMFETGGFLWLLKDAYGSCSHYDDYVLSMLRNAYAFDNTAFAMEFLEEKKESSTRYSWGGVATEALEILQDGDEE